MKKSIAVEKMSNGGAIFAVKETKFSRYGYGYSVCFSSAEGKVATIITFNIIADADKYLPIVVDGFAKLFEGFSSDVVCDYFINGETVDDQNSTFESCYGDILNNPDLTNDVKVTSILFSATRDFHNFAAKPSQEINSAKKFVKTEVFKSRQTVDDLKMLMYPFFSQYGVDEFDFMYVAKEIALPYSALSSPQYRDIVKRFLTIYSTPDDGDKETLFANMSIVSMKQYFQRIGYHIEQFPIQHKMYRDYLLGLHVWEVRLLLANGAAPNVVSNSTGEVAVSGSRNYLQSLEEGVSVVDTTRQLYDAAYDTMYKSMKRDDNIYGLDELHQIIDKHQDKTQSIIALTEFFKNSGYSTDFQMKTVEIVQLVLDNPAPKYSGFPKWIDKNIHIEHIMGKLFEVAGAEAVQHARDASKLCESPLTIKQWELFIKNYDTYGKIPATWWTKIL